MLTARSQRYLLVVVLAVAAVGALVGCGRAADGAKARSVFSEYDVPTPTAGLTAIAVDSKGRVWFTQAAADKVGMLDPKTKRITDFALPTRGSGVSDVAVGSDGRVWFAEPELGSVGYLEPATKAITERRLPHAGAAPSSLAAGADSLWVAERLTDTLDRLDTKRERVTEVPLPAGSAPTDVAVDSKGAAWFAGSGTRQIGTVGDDGAVSTFDIADGSPWALAVGSDGDVWFVCSDTAKLGVRRGSSGRIESFDLPDVPGEGTAVALGPDGDVWYLSIGRSRLCRLDVAKRTVKQYAIPTPACEPRGLSIAENGDVWFVESAPPANKVGVARGVAGR